MFTRMWTMNTSDIFFNLYQHYMYTFVNAIRKYLTLIIVYLLPIKKLLSNRKQKKKININIEAF